MGRGLNLPKGGVMKCWERDELCGKTECRHWLEDIELGNCVLRVSREYTLEEIGQRLGITRERVRQIEERALRRLRAEIIKAGIL